MKDASLGAGIERELWMLLPPSAPLRAPVEYALQGGKRARGLLLVAAGEGSSPEALLLRAAALLELLHAATLVQDDIFDRSRVRRGRPATHCVFGPRIATLASDWMLAEAIRSAHRLHPAFGDALSRCAQEMIAAEACELAPHLCGTAGEARERAQSIARGKTGELFGLAVSAPLLLERGPAAAGSLHEAGCALGVQFQYLDDALDLYGDESAAGKELGRDTAANLLTASLLDALALLPASLRGSWGGLPLPAHVLRAVASERVREHVLRGARLQWLAAVEAVIRELPRGERVRTLLLELAGKMLTEPQADLTAA